MSINLGTIAFIGLAFAGGFYYAQKKTENEKEEEIDKIRANVLDYLDLNFGQFYENEEEIFNIVDVITEYDSE